VIVVHHGHFTEPLYRMMSSLKSALFPRQLAPREIWDWEADNFAWIDFFWSTLGRSGEAGVDVGLVYDMLQERAALAPLAANLAYFVAEQLRGRERFIARLVLPKVARWLVPKVASRERSTPHVVLSEKTVKGLHEYLSGPVHRQLERERPDSASRDLVFVFGHTHKPFERSERVDGFTRPVAVVNSGGWVVDTEETSPVQGASIVLVDSDCGVVSLRMYNQVADASTYAVRLADTGLERDDPLRGRLEATLRFDSEPWSTFSAEIAEAVTNRHHLVPRLIDESVALTKEK